MNIKEQIYNDFGIDLDIGDGNGSKESPLRIQSTDPTIAARNELDFIDCVCRALNRQWQLVSRDWFDETNNILVTKISIIEIGEEQVFTETIKYYFILASNTIGNVPLICDLNDSKMPLPYSIGGVYYRKTVVNSPGNISYFFDGKYLRMGVYVYSLNDIQLDSGNSIALEAHAIDCISDVVKVHPDYKLAGDGREDDLDIRKVFISDSETSLLLLSAVSGKVVKLRLTYSNIPELDEIAMNTINAFRWLLNWALNNEK